jgi:energy-coupling factor transport system ATP-binding protein
MEGDVIVQGMNTRNVDVPDVARHVGMVFQDPDYQLVTGDTESEIAFGLEVMNLPEREIGVRIGEIAGLLHIEHLLGHSLADLSWGERQRVAIASVLAARPTLLVMDEPFSGIDTPAAWALAGLLADLKNRAGTTIIVLEHRTSFLFPHASRCIVMRDGEIAADTPQSPDIPVPDRLDSPACSDPAGVTIAPAPAAHVRDPCVCGTGRAFPPALSLKDVAYRYPGARAPVLGGITLDFYPGEVTVLAGANGSGKTTLLRHCNGLLVPDQGSVYLGTEPLSGKTVAGTARAVGLLGQHADFQIFESTITDELAFGPRNLGKSEGEITRILEKARAGCSLTHIDPATPPLGLSGGEKQRVAVAGILALETPVVILDEPTFGLDPALKNSFAVLLRSLSSSGKTVIIATHDEEFGRACGDRFIRISAGRIASDERVPPSRNIPPKENDFSGRWNAR